MAISKFTSEAIRKANADRGTALQVQRVPSLPVTAKCYVIALSVLAIFSIGGFFYWVAIQVVYPYELDYGEGIVLWQAQHVASLATAYAPLTHYPYIVFHYPPVYQAVSLGVSKVTGDLLLAGRLVSSFSGVAICLTLGWLIYRVAPAWVPRLAATCGAALAVAFPCGLEVMRWTPLMRVDMLGLWCTFAGLTIFVLARTGAQRYIALVLLLAAMYTRQTLVAGTVTCLIISSVINFREAVKMLFFMVFLGTAVLIALSLATHGEVIRHLFLYNLNRYSIRWAIGALNTNLVSTIPLIALAAAAGLGPLRNFARALFNRNPVSLRARLLASSYNLALFTFTVHFILAGFVSLSVGKAGSNINYFLEWNLSACALASLFVGRLLWSWRKNSITAVGALPYLLPMAMLAQQSLSVAHMLVHTEADRRTMAQRAQNSKALERILRNSPEPLMSEDMTLLYRAGKQVPFEPAIIAELTTTGVWNEAPLVNLIRNRTFSVMVIRDVRSGFYSPTVAAAIIENYRPQEKYGDLTVYVPSQ